MEYTIEGKASQTTSELLAAAGAEAAGLRAVWLGLPAARLVLPDDFDKAIGADVTSIRTFGATDCMADGLLKIVDELRLANECTCTFGHEGAYQIHVILADICSKKGKPGDLALLRDIAPVMVKQSNCSEGRAIGQAVIDVLDHFSDEVEAHITKKTCTAGSCVAYMTYHVLVSKCTGCTKCLKACDDKAIMGKAKFVHVIDQRKCSGCDRCRSICPTHAIVRAGAKKPKCPPRPIPVKRK